jgi:hypothetical protein
MRSFTSEININNNNPSKIGAFLTIFKANFGNMSDNIVVVELTL